VCHRGRVGFFDEAVAAASIRAAERDRIAAVRHRLPPWARDERDVPVSVPVDGLVWHGERAALGIGGVSAVPNGFSFTVHLRWRDRDPDRAARRVAGRRRHDVRGGGEVAVTVGWPDGGWCAPTDEPPADDTAPRIVEDGGSSTDDAADMRFWVSPLPPPGPVTLVLGWPAEMDTDLRIELDGQRLRDAGARSARPWGSW
jgi:hypothetical protein